MGDNDRSAKSDDGRFEFRMEGYEFAPAAHSGGTSYGLEIIRIETGERLLKLSVLFWDAGGPVELGNGIVQTTIRSFAGTASPHVILGLDLDGRRFCVEPTPYPSIWRTRIEPEKASWREDWDAIETALDDCIALKEANQAARKAMEPSAPVPPAPVTVPHDDYDTNALIEIKRSGGKTTGIVGLDPEIDRLDSFVTPLGQSNLQLVRVRGGTETSGFIQELRDADTGTVLLTLPGGNWLVRDAAPNDPGVLALTPLEAGPTICILIEPVKRFCATPGNYWQEFDFLDSCWRVTDEHRSNMPLRRGKTVPVRSGMPQGADGNGYFEMPPPVKGMRQWEYRYGVATGNAAFRQSLHLVGTGEVIENLPVGEWMASPASSGGLVRFSLGQGAAYPDFLVNLSTGQAALDLPDAKVWADAGKIPARLDDHLAGGGLEGRLAIASTEPAQASPAPEAPQSPSIPPPASGVGRIVLNILKWSGIGCLSIFLLLLLIGWMAS